MREQEQQENFLEILGRTKADAIYRLWGNTYPQYCSINNEYPKQHTKTEVFKARAKKEGFTQYQIELFLSLD